MVWPDPLEQEFYDDLLNQAIHDGVAPLICHLLKPSADWKNLSENFRVALLEQLRSSAAIEMVRARDLSGLLEAFEKRGITALVIKGGALAYTHYDEPFLRTRCDTDIFIDLGDIRKTRKVFLDLGYKLDGQIYKSHQFNGSKFSFGMWAINYDVHSRLNNCAEYARIISYASARKESLAIPALGDARTLGPVHTLLLACMHRAGNPDHDPDRLIWLYDIHLLVSVMPDVQLLRFAQLAVAEHIQGICREAIDKASLYFATRVPAKVQEVLLLPGPDRSPFQRFSRSQLALIFDDLKELPDAASRWELVREFLFPSEKYLLTRYGKEGRGWLPFLYLRYVFGGFFSRVFLR